MSDPFKIDGPTCINFSGGRTSAYMLWRVLKANKGFGHGDKDRAIVFANTGKEDPATYDFVREVSRRWGVSIDWVEYRPDEPGYAWVGPVHYSKNGEPFEALIQKRNYLPNPVSRFCTTELKIICVEKFLRAERGWDEWDSMVGIRADEPRRVAKVRKDPSGGRRGVERTIPLAAASASMMFWPSGRRPALICSFRW
jgi:3'-phosphoadenosine 5'-phosphosulfate sulfotransferase (PAPS reductase)/FAD synthetase